MSATTATMRNHANHSVVPLCRVCVASGKNHFHVASCMWFWRSIKYPEQGSPLDEELRCILKNRDGLGADGLGEKKDPQDAWDAKKLCLWQALAKRTTPEREHHTVDVTGTAEHVNFAMIGAWEIETVRSSVDLLHDEGAARDFASLRDQVRTLLPASLMRQHTDHFLATSDGARNAVLEPGEKIVLFFTEARLKIFFAAFDMVFNLEPGLPTTKAETQALALLLELAATPTWSGLLNSGLFEEGGASAAAVCGPDEWFVSSAMRAALPATAFWSTSLSGRKVLHYGRQNWLIDIVAQFWAERQWLARHDQTGGESRSVLSEEKRVSADAKSGSVVSEEKRVPKDACGCQGVLRAEVGSTRARKTPLSRTRDLV